MSTTSESPSRVVTATATVLLAYLAFALVLAAAFPLADPDEGRNAEVMREMLALADPVIPHLAGMPYLDKPPGLFWAGAASLAVFGRSPFAARLPSVLAALATLALLAFALARLGLRARTPALVALTASAPLFLAMGSYVIFDMPLTACVSAVWLLIALEAELGPRTARRVALFAAIGAGVLVKGPVMLAWAVGGALAAAAVARSRTPLAWMAWAPGWLIALGIAGAWFGAAVARHPEYVRYAFLEESLERMTSGSFQREQPAWFAPAVLVGGALPWSLVTPWRAPHRRAARIAAGFVVFALIFFTVSRSKLVTYLLPALPALAWWAGECWAAARGRRPGVLLTAWCVVLAPALVFAGTRGLGAEAPAGSDLARALVAAGVATALLAPFALGAAVLARPGLALAAACGWAPAVFALAGGPLATHVRTTSGAPLAEALAARGNPTVTYVNCYSPGTDFLVGRRGRVVSRHGHEITSNYIVRYRDALRASGRWTLLDAVPWSATGVLVEPARTGVGGAAPFHADRRFTARTAGDATTPTR